jgi:hypothetical protein
MARLSIVLPVVCAFGGALCAGKQAASQPTRQSDRQELIALSHKIEQQVEDIRGWKFKHPVPTDVYSEPQLRGFIEKKIFEEQYGGDRLEQTQQMLRMVGLIPADCDLRKTIMDILLSQIGGFYDPDTKAFYMLKRAGIDYGPLLNSVMIAHELTHALDDQYLDLNKFIKSREQTEDSAVALGCVVEGSATLLMMEYMTARMRDSKVDLSALAQVAKDEAHRSEAFMNAPRYFTTLLANYLLGMSFVSHGDADAIQEEKQSRRLQENMRHLAEDPPRSSEQILHPEKYWDPQHRDDPIVIDDGDVQAILERDGWRVVHSDTIGEMLCAILTSPSDQALDVNQAMLASYWTNDAASGWGGDRFYLLQQTASAKDDGKNKGPAAASAPAHYRGVWVTIWDTPDDRTEFEQDYREQRQLPDRGMARIGDRCAIYFFDVPAAERDSIIQDLQNHPPRGLPKPKR